VEAKLGLFAHFYDQSGGRRQTDIFDKSNIEHYWVKNTGRLKKWSRLIIKHHQLFRISIQKIMEICNDPSGMAPKM